MRAPSAPGLSSESTVNRPWSEGSSTVQRRYVKSVIEGNFFFFFYDSRIIDESVREMCKTLRLFHLYFQL